MYEAEYDYESDHKNILSFKTGERFIAVHSEHSARVRHGWIFVIGGHLKCGYIPETYVKCLPEEDEEKLVDKLFSMVTLAIRESDDEGERHKLRKILAKLQPKINSANKSTTNGGLDIVTPEVDQSGTVTALSEVEHSDSVSTPADPVPKNPTLAHTPVHHEQASATSLDVSNLIGSELIEYVQRETSLSHKQARSAAESVLEFLGERLPSVRAITSAIVASIKGTSPSGETLENSHDWTRLCCIFSTILDVKSDVEQLNWALYEDQHIIVEFLEELISLLTDGDPLVCKRFLEKDQYRNVEALVQYFHMEVRPPIRQMLLKVFAALCSLDRLSISVLVNSELPLLLAQDIQDANHDLQKLTYSCLLLTMLMWTGETLPVNHYDVLNENFVNFILDLMDNPSSDDEAEQIADSCTELLLAFNLQFKEPSSNIVIHALRSRRTAKEFLEKLVVLVNREDDPVGAMFDHCQPPPNSVHKALLDIFAAVDTAKLFYQNDLKVLIEIVGRKLIDLPPEDKMQTTYLLLAYNIICSTDYAEHCHCQDELQQCFERILHEDVDSSSTEASKAVARQICTAFPDLFYVA